MEPPVFLIPPLCLLIGGLFVYMGLCVLRGRLPEGLSRYGPKTNADGTRPKATGFTALMWTFWGLIFIGWGLILAGFGVVIALRLI